MREIVIPGEKILDSPGAKAGYGTYKGDDGVYSSLYGLVEKRDNFVKVIPLVGKYMPIPGDYIIGVVTYTRPGFGLVDIKSAYLGYLRFERDNEFKVGDLVIVEVVGVNEIKKVDLENARRLDNGKLIAVSSVKVPRIIGKKGSMISMVKQSSGSRIFVGRNGRVFISGGNVRLAEDAIRMIEKEAHTDGLTDRMKNYLEKKVN